MYFRRLTIHESVTWLNGSTRWLVGRRLGDHPQIVGNDAPAHPAFHPRGAVIAAAVQLMTPFQPTDATFDARAPIPPAPEPGLLLMRDPLGRLRPGLGQHHLLDPVRDGILLVRGGMDAPIPSQ